MDGSTNLKILIVEDEYIIALDISGTLSKLGFEISGIAGSGEEALALTEKMRPDLILIDIVLRGAMDGIEFAGVVKERFNIPFIYMTANADMSTIHRARYTEPYGYVLKPVNWRELYSNIDSAIHRYRIESSLRESEEKFNRAFHASPLLMAISTIEEGRYIEVNDSFLRTMGVSHDELIGRTSQELGFFADYEKRNKIIGKVMETGFVKNYELKMKTRSGDIRHGLFSAELLDLQGGRYLLTVMNDITDLKQAESQKEAALESLKASEERYRILFSSATEGILVADAETKRFYHANPAICAMLGYKEEELLRLSSDDVHPAADLKFVMDEFDALVRKEKVRATNIPCLRKDGSVVYADISAVPLMIDGKRCLSGFFTEVTERVRFGKKS